MKRRLRHLAWWLIIIPSAIPVFLLEIAHLPLCFAVRYTEYTLDAIHAWAYDGDFTFGDKEERNK